MKCNSKTMLTVALGLGLVVTLAYFMPPAARTLILGNAPLLVALVCPVLMLLMMKSMNPSQPDREARTDEREHASGVGDLEPDKA